MVVSGPFSSKFFERPVTADSIGKGLEGSIGNLQLTTGLSVNIDSNLVSATMGLRAGGSAGIVHLG